MKKIKLNIEDIFQIPTARIYDPDNFEAVSAFTIDSRKVLKGAMFIAIKGKKYDGHDFVKSAIRQGASSVMINRRNLARYDNVSAPIIAVDNTTKALGSLANLWRRKLKARVIGLTGSTGKTSTKDMLATLLSEGYKVSKTISNNNNHIGVPLTILSTNEMHEVLIAELGTNHFGEIEYSAQVLEPEYALITNIGNSHLEHLVNKRGVLLEKKKLTEITRKNDGTVFINYDDPILKGYSRKLDDFVSFGFNKGADVMGSIVDYTNDGRPLVRIKYKDKILENTLPIYGEQSALNYLAATTIALTLGLSKRQIKKGTKKLISVKGRLQVNKLKNFILIDDTYNASPDSMRAAIELTSKIKTYNKKVLVLGDMLELGKGKTRHHESLASTIIKSKIDELYCIGTQMNSLAAKLQNKKILAKHFRTRNSLSGFLSTYDCTNKVILTKGSRGMKMEEFVQLILLKVKS